MTTPTPNLATLLSRSSLHDDEDLLASANTALSPKSKTPLSDSDRLQALHVKAVALLRLDRFQEALAVYEKEGLKAGEGEGALAFAYALYKTGRQKEAAEVAAKAAGVVKGSRRERGLKMLEAQAVSSLLSLVAKGSKAVLRFLYRIGNGLLTRFDTIALPRRRLRDRRFNLRFAAQILQYDRSRNQ